MSEEDRPLEYLMNRLRLMTPIAKTEFEQRTGQSADVVKAGMKKSIDRGLLTETDTHWQLTPKGHMFVNDLLSQFI